jgi:hypothetical protein
MDCIETLRLRLREVHAPHGTDLESFLFNALNNSPGEPPLDGIRFDNREGPLGHSMDYNSG